MIRIEVPATSANLGSGFDCLGLALTMYNQVWMEEADGVEIISRDGLSIPVDESNLIYWSAKSFMNGAPGGFPACISSSKAIFPWPEAWAAVRLVLWRDCWELTAFWAAPYPCRNW